MSQVIPVVFHGTELFVIEHNGEPYTPMKPIVEGMGLTWQPQLLKLHQRFSKGITEIVIPSSSGNQKMVCLALRKLAAWLATISPNKVRSEIRGRVIQYQNECDDVLYEYWTTGEVKNKQPKINPVSQSEIDAYNINALAQHYQVMVDAWSYQIEPALRKIESPLAGRLRDRFIDGAIFLSYVKKSLNEKLGEGQRPRLSNNL
ncbi:phage antirepressor N-terminal domain-containing protein [Yersinia enterocolitica]|nr:phage antirepressor N-terminal domain-containing protein [Yersinia enterocolitica]MBW5823190.1 phage antirepressor N-terminal domain-containing protein [Yersinia enterocolitica]MBW5853173.1 phage antirepressor N-terminal domain-containing protein [Yersinia enterocolitica]MBW5870418.1 phage antirepressor N-terminal domain-containing protein [Yersinia enterocolitica]MBW5879289.1 phage antirepressor N-terminal domain-containing protein [Yersinia enterocolitica]